MNVVRLGLIASCCIGHASGRILDVGPGHTFAAPGEAARAASDGDTITIAPGTYYDCAVWQANRLTIAATGPDTVITDQACMGKAAFVVSGDNVTIRGLTFARVRVIDGNGAGIRAEGHDLTVTDSRFVNNQIGILAGGDAGTLYISGCDFDGNGAASDGQATHAVLAGALDRLRIEGSIFRSARGGDYIASTARRTELVANGLFDEGGRMPGALVWVNGGAVTLERNHVDLRSRAPERPGAVLITGNASAIIVRGNALHASDGTLPLVRNWTGLTATAEANTMSSGTAAVSESGAYYHRMRFLLAGVRKRIHEIAALAWHIAREVTKA